MTRSQIARRIAAGAIVLALAPVMAEAQRGGFPPAPQPPRLAAPIDLTGYWVSMIVDEWRFRVTPQKGDILYLPLNAEARQLAATAKSMACRVGSRCGVAGRNSI